MDNGCEDQGAPFRAPPLATVALEREGTRARRLLAAGEWRPEPADARAAGAVLHRLTAPLPTRRGASARTVATDRDRRLHRILRSAVHHLDAGAVTPAAAAVLAATARALVPWHSVPNPPPAAAAPRFGLAPGVAAPTAAGEALLPVLTALFTDLAAPVPAGSGPLTPPAATREVPHAGRFRRYGKPGYGVWTAETVRCAGCGGKDGPWTVSCDWRRTTLHCDACGAATTDHGLAPSEVWLLLPDV
ncbi:hypothetical protein [Streptomyces sp. NPDC093225]|uniref:hypothetical protein n=1 Tax=Streptomyces sp. NPDC093225 TaxID=3366034 RepID=UPI0038171A2A